MKLILLIGALIFATSLQANTSQKPAWLVDNTSLLSLPQHGASMITSITKGQAVTVIQRIRAWYQIKTPQGNEGWVKMLALRFQEPKADEGIGLKSLWNNVSNSGTETTVATGVRGFDEEDLQSAAPNIEAVDKLENYQASSQQAKNFAQQGKLKTNTISEE